MLKMCSDESKRAAKKGCLCSEKKIIRKFGWINRIFLVKRSFRNWNPAFAIEMCSDEFSLKHALKYTYLNTSLHAKGAVHKIRHVRGDGGSPRRCDSL